MDEYELTLGLPHTNHVGLAEHLLLMHAGHCQWTSIARAIGMPLSALRTSVGGEVYATFYYVELRFPHGRSNADFALDERLRFLVSLRSYKGMAIEGRIRFDHADRMPADAAGADAHPQLHFANIFITPEAGNSRLRVAVPIGVDFSRIPVLPNDENPYHITQRAAETGRLGVLGDDWVPAGDGGPIEYGHAIDPDRDSNGAGLVYFANYVAFMDAAERHALAVAIPSAPQTAPRPTLHRRIAYYGNVTLDGRIRVSVERFSREGDQSVCGFRYTIARDPDDLVICRSEAIKMIR